MLSYPLYLWHWPLLSFGFIIYGEKPAYQVTAGLILAVFALAFLTYRYLETPFRHGRNKARMVTGLAGGMAGTAAVGLTIAFGWLHERINVNGAEVYLNALNDSQFPGAGMTPYRHQGMVFQRVASRNEQLTVFIGDSLMQQYGPYIEHTLARYPDRFNSVIFATAGGCARFAMPCVCHWFVLPIALRQSRRRMPWPCGLWQHSSRGPDCAGIAPGF